MSKTYTVEWSERKTTSTGKKKIDCLLNDGTVKVENVTIWDGFPNFDTLMTGHQVEGDIVEKQNGQYLNRTLYPKKPEVFATSPTGAPRGGFIAKAQETKREGIREAQENKEWGIKTSSTIRMAVDLTIASLRNEDIIDNSIIKGTINEWRKWLLDNWDVEQPNVPF